MINRIVLKQTVSYTKSRMTQTAQTSAGISNIIHHIASNYWKPLSQMVN